LLVVVEQDQVERLIDPVVVVLVDLEQIFLVIHLQVQHFQFLLHLVHIS
jgi:hypothetical protein